MNSRRHWQIAMAVHGQVAIGVVGEAPYPLRDPQLSYIAECTSETGVFFFKDYYIHTKV